MVWKRGESGNPGGRPAAFPEFKAACQALTPEVLNMLARAIKNGAADPTPITIEAAKLLMAYGYGKPTQVVDMNVEGKLTLEQLVMQSFQAK